MADRRGRRGGEERGWSPVRLRQRAVTWLGVLVLAINLFGWTLVPPPSAEMVATALLPGMPMCHHGPDGQSDGRGDHGGPLCPACFPLGNATCGALVAVSPELALPAMSADRLLFDGDAVSIAWVPHPYLARGPPG